MPLPVRDPPALLHGVREVRQERAVHRLPDGPRTARPVRVPEALLHGPGDVLQDGPVHGLPDGHRAARAVLHQALLLQGAGGARLHGPVHDLPDRDADLLQDRPPVPDALRARGTRLHGPVHDVQDGARAADEVRAEDDLRDAAVLPDLHDVSDGPGLRAGVRDAVPGPVRDGLPDLPAGVRLEAEFLPTAVQLRRVL